MIIRSVQPSASNRTQNISSAMENCSLNDQQWSNSSGAISSSDNDFNTEFDISSMIILHQNTFESNGFYYKIKKQVYVFTFIILEIYL